MTKGSSVRGRRGAWAHAALPLALGCLVLQLVSTAHFVIAPHSICPEHGEIVDGAAHHRGVAAPVTRAGLVSRAKSSGEPASHEHDHCFFASHRREVTPGAREAVRVAACVRPSSNPASVQHAQALSPIDLILVAPKSSPPDAAAV